MKTCMYVCVCTCTDTHTMLIQPGTSIYRQVLYYWAIPSNLPFILLCSSCGPWFFLCPRLVSFALPLPPEGWEYMPTLHGGAWASFITPSYCHQQPEDLSSEASTSVDLRFFAEPQMRTWEWVRMKQSWSLLRSHLIFCIFKHLMKS